eukprot:1660375-Rhodomonas_salina.1
MLAKAMNVAAGLRNAGAVVDMQCEPKKKVRPFSHPPTTPTPHSSLAHAPSSAATKRSFPSGNMRVLDQVCNET